jgi:hypothetical protein
MARWMDCLRGLHVCCGRGTPCTTDAHVMIKLLEKRMVQASSWVQMSAC